MAATTMIVSSSSSSSYIPAIRLPGGMIHGTVFLCPTTTSTTTTTTTTTTNALKKKYVSSSSSSSQSAPPQPQHTTIIIPTDPHASSAVSYFAVFFGTNMQCYENYDRYSSGDFPVYSYHIVGGAAASTSTTTLWYPFQCVTNQGTQIHGWTMSESCLRIWLNGFQTGLELSLRIPYVMPNTKNSNHHNHHRNPTSLFGSSSSSTTTTSTSSAHFFMTSRLLPPNRSCAICGVTPEHSTWTTTSSSPTNNTTPNKKIVLMRTVPIPHQAHCESRQDVCMECSIVQGVCDHLYFIHMCYIADTIERECILQARNSIMELVGAGSSPKHYPNQNKKDDVQEEDESQPPEPDEEEEENDIQILNDYFQSMEFQTLARNSYKLHVLAHEFGNHGTIASIPEVLEFLDMAGATAHERNPTNTPTTTETEAAQPTTDSSNHNNNTNERSLAISLKKQAFRMAGDMGTAMKLLLEQTIPKKQPSSSSSVPRHHPMYNPQYNPYNHSTTEVLQYVLEFFLDQCAQEPPGSASAVAFFWPQLCHIHLRMLPPTNSIELARVELMEDFLITVSTQYSIHLALQLIWSHTADLEESLQIPLCNAASYMESSSGMMGNAAGSGASSSSSSTTPESAVYRACRRRRFAVLRFLCELESILFALEGGWGGGSIALGKFLQPTPQQAEIMKVSFVQIQNLRIQANEQCPPHLRNRLQRSARYDLVMAKERNQHLAPEIQAREKLRVARNADYFTCHWNFSKRLADITERLRFMDVNERAGFLEEELNLLNASGTMGGDPLNRVRDTLIRVVRVPSTESHVFRSKERTPVLLLVEVVEELADAEMFSKKDDEKEEDTSMNKEESHEKHRSEKTAMIQSQRESETRARMSSESSSELAGSDDGFKPTHSPKALKRFDSDGDEIDPIQTPRTPKRDIAELVNHAAQVQLNELVLPDMDNLTSKDDDHGEATDEKNVVENSSSSPNNDSSTRKVDVKGSHANDVVEIPEGRKEMKKNLYAKERGSKKRFEKSSSKKSTLGSLSSLARSTGGSTNTLAPTGDIRRSVLTTIMMRGIQGNTIAAGTADSVTRSLQELERKRATELLLSDDGEQDSNDGSTEKEDKIDSARQKLVSLGLSIDLEEAELAARPSEEDEVMESIRLLLIQNRVNQGHLSQDDAAKVLQHTSLSSINAAKKAERDQVGKFDIHDYPTIDAGDVDSRLVGCGPLPPAVMQALTLWKGGMVTNAELLELVKKDIEFVKYSVLLDAQSYAQENSAFWGRFSYGERWAEKKARIASSSPQGSVPGWDLLGVIVKSNDDLRQEAFIMQLIELCQEAFELSGLELWVNPYRILATGRTTGVIECVRNAMSFDALKKRPGYGKGGLREHLLRMTEFTADPGDAFKNAQRNFVRSLAAYSLMSYFFLFKDRHNGNILLDTAGHVIHIDFGFVFGVAPGGSFSLEMSTPFKLTDEMLDVMGGLRSPLFSEFVILFCCGFLCLQSHCDTFLTLVEITCEGSTFKCFEGQSTEEVVAKLKERFSPHLSKEETVSLALDLIKQATTSYGTRQYDLFQYLSQGIIA